VEQGDWSENRSVAPCHPPRSSASSLSLAFFSEKLFNSLGKLTIPLATDIPALWATSTTTAADRKEIIHQLVERVVVDVQGSSERVSVRIEWIGGGHSEGIVLRPVGQLSELSTYPQICQQVQTLTEAGWTARPLPRR
jgi:hypothetical protein